MYLNVKTLIFSKAFFQSLANVGETLVAIFHSMFCLFRLVPENGQVLCSGLYNGTCKNCSKDVTFWSVPSPVSEITFTVNGTKYTVTNPDPGMSLNEWLRDQPGLQGRLITHKV